ncbi:hypothetical protein GH714_027209 [Hevea brasiliensis]|uniref:Major facilitator superfamily (MFS) profile domain-containing protein n=1 Tax=Hevea brasiliensis TaxID=3981 RepID=A0A6A6MIG2_HEVBR|nr:hypothetical protein GH714_027209 [Hevea brasiliensis]
MATSSITSTVYIHVIEDVINKVRDEFISNGGPGESVLNELEGIWEMKMMQAGVICGPIERSSASKPAPGGPITPVHDLNVPYEGTEEYETPTAEILFPPTPLQTPIPTPLPGSVQTPLPGNLQTPLPGNMQTPSVDNSSMYNVPTGPTSEYPTPVSDTGGSIEAKSGRPSPYMQPPSPWMNQRPPLDVNIAYVEGQNETDRVASQQPRTQDFFMMSSGKRKREDFGTQYNNGEFIPQQDGAGMLPMRLCRPVDHDYVFDYLASQGNGALGRHDMITNANISILSHATRQALKIPQLGPYLILMMMCFQLPIYTIIRELLMKITTLRTRQLLMVTRTKSRWKCTLKDGIMHINNKDILFNKVEFSAGQEAESLVPDATQEEPFAWSSVILPFLFPALGGLLFGYDIGATSGATISLQSAELSGTTWFNLSAIELGLVVSGSLYGALLGSLLVYPIADFLGLGVLLVGRLLYGLGIGLAMHGAPLYIAETCPSPIRGTLISLKELFIVLEFCWGWRNMYGFGVPIAFLMGLGMWSLPPSPRWLLLRAVQGKGSLQDYKEKAIFALSKLRGRLLGDKVSEKQIEDTLVSLKSAYSEEDSEGSILEVFQGPSLKAFIIAGGLVFFQQITGQPSVLYYAGPILQGAGFSAAADATRVSVIIGLFKLLMTWIAVLKVDDLGRRPLLIGGVGGIVFSLFLLSAYYKFLGGFPFVAVAALLLYVGCYQISFGPISWLMVSEIFPLRTRGKGISLAVLTNFGSNAIVTFVFSPLKELLGVENLFLLFGAIALLSLLFTIVFVPETKGLSLEEIESKILK